MKEQEAVVKQVKKEFTSILTKIRENLKRKKHCERQIRSIYKSKSNLSSQETRQISSLLNDQEGFERALTELFASQTANIQRLKELNYYQFVYLFDFLHRYLLPSTGLSISISIKFC